MDKPDLDQPDSFSNFNRLNRRLSGLDERGLVLSLSAFAEDSLGDLLRAFMQDHAAANDLLDGFNAPLGTFSSRIKASVSLGLITDEQFSDLENLRKIRNQFSHTWENISFDDQAIRSRIENLSFSSLDDQFPTSSFEKVKSSISAILVEICATISQIEKRDLRAKTIGNRLIAGLSGNDHESRLTSARNKINDLRNRFSSADKKEKDFLLMIRQRLLMIITMAARGAPQPVLSRYVGLLKSLEAEDWAEADQCNSDSGGSGS